MDEEDVKPRFGFIIDNWSRVDNKLHFTFHLAQDRLPSSDVILIIETWLEQFKQQTKNDITENLSV